MSPTFAAAIAAVLAAGPTAQAPAPPATPASPRSPAPPAQPAPRAEGALVKCWAREVTAACTSRQTDSDEAAVEACKAERAKTACPAERAAYEKELAAGLASDALDLLGTSIKRVCAAEATALSAGKLRPEQEATLAAGWHEALEVRSEFMKACEKSGREARECDERANEAERNARAEACPTRK